MRGSTLAATLLLLMPMPGLAAVPREALLGPDGALGAPVVLPDVVTGTTPEVQEAMLPASLGRTQLAANLPTLIGCRGFYDPDPVPLPPAPGFPPTLDPPPPNEAIPVFVKYRFGESCAESLLLAPTAVGNALFSTTVASVGTSYRFDTTVAALSPFEGVPVAVGFLGLNLGLNLTLAAAGVASIAVEIPQLLPPFLACPTEVTAQLGVLEGGSFRQVLFSVGPDAWGPLDAVMAAVTPAPFGGTSFAIHVEGRVCDGNDLDFDGSFSVPLEQADVRVGTGSSAVHLTLSGKFGTPLQGMHFLHRVQTSEGTQVRTIDVRHEAVLDAFLDTGVGPDSHHHASITRVPRHVQVVLETPSGGGGLSRFYVAGDDAPHPGTTLTYRKSVPEPATAVVRSASELAFDADLSVKTIHVDANFVGSGFVDVTGTFQVGEEAANEQWVLDVKGSGMTNLLADVDLGSPACGCTFYAHAEHDTPALFLDAKLQKRGDDGLYRDLQHIVVPALPGESTLTLSKQPGDLVGTVALVTEGTGEGKSASYRFRSKALNEDRTEAPFSEVFVDRIAPSLDFHLSERLQTRDGGVDHRFHALVTHDGSGVQLRLDLRPLSAGAVDVAGLPGRVDFQLTLSPSGGQEARQPTRIVANVSDAPPLGSTFRYQNQGKDSQLHLHLERLTTANVTVDMRDGREVANLGPMVVAKLSFDDRAGEVVFRMSGRIVLNNLPDIPLNVHATGTGVGGAHLRYNVDDEKLLKIVNHFRVGGRLDLSAVGLAAYFERESGGYQTSYALQPPWDPLQEGECEGRPAETTFCAAPGGCSEASLLRVYQGATFAEGCARFAAAGTYDVHGQRFDNYDLLYDANVGSGDIESLKVARGYKVKACNALGPDATCQEFRGGKHVLPDGLRNNVRSLQIIPPLQVPSYGLSAIWTGTHAYLFGGAPGEGLCSTTNKIFRYDPVTGDYEDTGDRLPSPRYFATAVWTGSVAYIFGGGTGCSSGINEVIRYNPSTHEVVSLGGTGFDGAWVTSAVWDGQFAYVFGGVACCGLHSDKVQRFDPSTETFQVLPQRLPVGVAYSTAVWSGSKAYVLSNYGSAQVLQFDPATGGSGSAGSLSSIVYGASSVWTGSRVVLFGGASLQGSPGDLIQVYDPGTQATSVHAQRLPHPLVFGAAVWTGDVALVFSGGEPFVFDP